MIIGLRSRLTPSSSSTLKIHLKWVTTKAAPFHLFIASRSSANAEPGSDYEQSLVSALKSCASYKGVIQGRQLHGLVFKSGLDFNTFIGNSLINMYAKCGCIHDAELLFGSSPRLDPVSCNIMIDGYVRLGELRLARQVFDKTPEKGCVSFTTMIMGLSKSGQWWNAIELFRDMMVNGLVPNEVTMASVLSAYAHLEGGVCSGGMLHGLVVRLGIAELVLVSTNLVLLYCTCSKLEEAEDVINTMPMEADVVIWGTLLAACRKHENVEIGERAAQHLTRLDPSHGAGRVLLSNIYLENGRWEDASLVRREIRSQRMIRSPAYSGFV
uniref:Pentatricopeptide repeat-containing protein n=1 Tax=Kalanchoe fedtschenkoi TaxID=63787 RepID=A0A7N0VFE8_KALFE